MPIDFEIIGHIRYQETIATGEKIRDLDNLISNYGRGRWIKKKGIAKARLQDGSIWLVEVHWYYAKNIGAKEHKIKTHIMPFDEKE